MSHNQQKCKKSTRCCSDTASECKIEFGLRTLKKKRLKSIITFVLIAVHCRLKLHVHLEYLLSS